MPMFQTCFPALAVSTIYLVWRTYQQTEMTRQFALHVRVAYMLWVTAEPMKMIRQGDGCRERCESVGSS